MEPDDTPLHDMPLHDLLGAGDDSEPGPDPLRAIVARARRRRWRLVAGGMAVALIVGGALGYTFSNHSSTATETSTGATTAAAGARAATSSASGGADSGTNAATAPGALIRAGVNGPLSRLFTRTTGGGVTLRVFRTVAVTPPALPADCAVNAQRIQVEVSTATMVGITIGSAPATHSKPVTAVESEMVGQAEGDSTAVAMVATGPTVTQTRVSFKGGTSDSMAPVDGWAVLAGPVSANLNPEDVIGTLTAVDAAGHVVGSASLMLNAFQPITGASCTLTCPKPAVGAPAGAPATTPPLTTCLAPPCGGVLPGRAPAGGTVPLLMPALRAGRALACATGGSAASSGAPSGTSSAGNNSAAG